MYCYFCFSGDLRFFLIYNFELVNLGECMAFGSAMLVCGRICSFLTIFFYTFSERINYLNRYSALSAHLEAPLSALTHQAVDYKPDKVHFENFNRLKVEISNIRALPYFAVNAETTLQMDASKKGLGACLIQKGKVICYASRALTKTEQNYQNLEREALGTIWGMEKFQYFLYGKKFTLETDQKPLVSIYKKHMIDISPRV